MEIWYKGNVKTYQPSAIGTLISNQNVDFQVPVVQTLDSAIRWINLYPVDSAIGFPNTYPLDSDLSDG